MKIYRAQTPQNLARTKSLHKFQQNEHIPGIIAEGRMFTFMWHSKKILKFQDWFFSSIYLSSEFLYNNKRYSLYAFHTLCDFSVDGLRCITVWLDILTFTTTLDCSLQDWGSPRSWARFGEIWLFFTEQVWKLPLVWESNGGAMKWHNNQQNEHMPSEKQEMKWRVDEHKVSMSWFFMENLK